MAIRIQLEPNDGYNQELVANVHPPDWQNPTPDGRYNLVVIGGGSAGLVSAIGAAGLGAKVALIEKHLLGGDCLNVGCVPSKAVIRPARAIGEIRRAAEFGVDAPAGVSVDFEQVMARMRRIRAGVSHHDSAQRLTNAGVDLFFGEARFTGLTQVEVAGQTLAFKKAVIATGSRPATLPVAGLAEAGYLTNETVWGLTAPLKRLAVIGAGPVGVELAQAFRRLGTQVVLIDMAAQALIREDQDAAAVVQESLARDGVDLRLGAQIQQVHREGDEKCVTFAQDGRSHTTTVNEILLAVGRQPNVEGMNLETAGIEYNNQGVVVNDYLQTSNTHVYAAGDVALRHQFTHAADAAARIVIQNALFLGRKKLSGLTIPWVTYTDPEVAHVGLYTREAEAQGMPVDTFTTYLQDTDRGRTDGVQEGFVRIHVKKGTDQIVGATIVAPHAGEMISEVTLAMVAGVGLKTLGQVIHPYPTYAEAIRKTADTYNRTRLTPTVRRLFDRWLAWMR